MYMRIGEVTDITHFAECLNSCRRSDYYTLARPDQTAKTLSLYRWTSTYGVSEPVIIAETTLMIPDSPVENGFVHIDNAALENLLVRSGRQEWSATAYETMSAAMHYLYGADPNVHTADIIAALDAAGFISLKSRSSRNGFVDDVIVLPDGRALTITFDHQPPPERVREPS